MKQEVIGKYAKAVVYSDKNNFVEDYALSQIKQICDCECNEGSTIRVMPDVHPGKVCPIGLTMTVKDKVMPNLVSTDVGCGMTMVHLKNVHHIEYKQLASIIRQRVPSGFDVRRVPHRFASEFDFSLLSCSRHIMHDKAMASIGTLGGGNHFIEVDKDTDDSLYIIVHSGSRHLGQEMTAYYLAQGYKALLAQGIDIPYELTYLTGDMKDDYIADLQVVQDFAQLNRRAIIDSILKGMKIKIDDYVSCVHNYISNEGGILMLRKGAVSAKKGEQVIVPINMKDGVIIGKGKGNKDWNYSVPHGAGRIANRKDLRNSVTMSAFKKEMKGIYVSNLSSETLDESPFAYRRIDAIKDAIEPTLNIEKILMPVYNFKAGGKV